MATIFSAQANGTIGVFNTNGDAKVGRWCDTVSGQYPDRCSCFDPKTMLNRVATYYYLNRTTIDGKVRVWRNGLCTDCASKLAKRVYRIPKEVQ